MKKTNNLIKLAAMIPLAAVLVGCGRTSIDANDYLEIDISGVNTKGEASAYIDVEEMIVNNLEAFDLTDSSNLLALATVEDNVDGNLTGSLDKEEDLSNGDTVTFKWDKSGIEKIEEKYKVRLKINDKKVDISDLEEAKEFDPFDSLKVTFDGTAPNGSVKLDYNDLPVSSISFYCDKDSNLSNGDKIKVTFGSDDCEEECFDQGYIPTTLEKEFTVEGLSSYVQKLDEIPEDAYDKMEAHAQDTFKSYVASEWSDPNTLKDFKLVGNYFLTPKSADIPTDANNYLYYIYEVTDKQADYEEDHKFYYYSRYNDILLLNDGTCSFDLGSIAVPQGSSFFSLGPDEGFSFNNYYYNGYADLDSMFNNLVTSKIDQYQYESTVK